MPISKNEAMVRLVLNGPQVSYSKRQARTLAKAFGATLELKPSQKHVRAIDILKAVIEHLHIESPPRYPPSALNFYGYASLIRRKMEDRNVSHDKARRQAHDLVNSLKKDRSKRQEPNDHS